MNKTGIALSIATLATLTVGCSSDDDKSIIESNANETSCSVEETDDGTVKIECPDGSSVTVQHGEDGRAGEDGERGKSGKNGATGEVGTKGVDGLNGEDGLAGLDGAPGENGLNGEDGLAGLDGGPGEDGLDGSPGENGLDGAPGQPGDAGASCSVECLNATTARIFCENGNEVSYQVESCKMPSANLLSTRGQHGCRILPNDRRLVCWGEDAHGKLGNGNIDSDQQFASLVDTRKLEYAIDTRFRSVDTGRDSSCGITVAGAAYCWGNPLKAGNGGLPSSVPTPVDTSGLPAGTSWSVISSGCGVTMLGAAYCWGNDTVGVLGNGPTLTTRQLTPSPVDISALPPETTWSTVSTGTSHACALTSEGVAYCWGRDTNGRLGNGPTLTANQASPSPVDTSVLPPETSWTAISVGLDHVCALTTEGRAYCWGSDTNERLGNGDQGAAVSPSPVDMTALPEGLTFAELSAGDQHTCGLASDGSAWCWGNRASGRLGDGLAEGAASSPVAVDVSLLPAETTWKTLSAGQQHSCGLTTKDEVYCWGNNAYGQLGSGGDPSLPQLRPGPAVPAAVGVLVEHAEFSGAVGINNPQLPLTVLSLNGASEQLSVTATSSDESIIPSANITITGTGESRVLSFEPIASGPVVVITVVVTSGEGEYSFTFEYGASGMPQDPAGVYYHHISDASTALDVGGGYLLLGDDETNVVFLYKQDMSGFPVKVWDFTAEEQLGSSEIDIEGAARSGDVIVWTASQGNSSKSGGVEERRRVIFATKISGSGADVELSFAGRYGGGPGGKSDVADLGLRTDLVAWDKANGHGMGADSLTFDAATQDGVFPFAPNGFGVEALEFAADDTTGYLGFRAPTINVGGSQHALIVPVTNLLTLVDGIGEQTGQAQFGTPILLDLAGRSIRAMRKNASGEYLISAGPPGESTPGVNDTWALYTWAGAGQPAVFNRELPDADLLTGGTWESIATVPDPLASGGNIRMVTDSGDSVFYSWETVKDTELGHRKSYSQLFTLQ